MGWCSGAEIGRKARSDSEEGMLVRYLKRLLSQLLVKATRVTYFSAYSQAALAAYGMGSYQTPNLLPCLWVVGSVPVGADRQPKV